MAARKFLNLFERLEGFPVMLAWEQDNPVSHLSGWPLKHDPKFSFGGIASPNTVEGEGPYRVTHFLYGDGPSGHFSLSAEEFASLVDGNDLTKNGMIARKGEF